MATLSIEPGGRLFRLRDGSGRPHRFSAFLVREALTGDGTCFPEDLAAMQVKPNVVELWPWSEGGGIRDFGLAEIYLGLLKKRFSSMFRRTNWEIALSPHLIESQGQGWRALLREIGVRQFTLVRNLDLLAYRHAESHPGLFLHWGAGGGDLGACLQGETYRYSRLFVGESLLCDRLGCWLEEKLGGTIGSGESHRLLRMVASSGLTFPGGRLVEVGLGEGPLSVRSSVEQEVLLQAVLGLLSPQLDSVEEFVRGLSADDHGDLFQHGLWLSGGGVALPLLRDCLAETFEFPVTLWEQPEEAVLARHSDL